MSGIGEKNEGEVVMKCDEIRERMPEVAAGFSQPTGDEGKHLESCASCAEELKAMRATMALLDEWQAPEPSAYFDTRLRARLREEMSKPRIAGATRTRRIALVPAAGIGSGTHRALWSWSGPVLHS